MSLHRIKPMKSYSQRFFRYGFATISTKVQSNSDDSRDLIRQHTLASRDHLTPEVELNLLTPETQLWHDNGPEAGKVFRNDPFWAIHWPGGQALARYILDQPDLVRGKSVFDLGSGSGAISIASLKSGAKRVLANDIDPLALEATKLNLTQNGLAEERVEVCDQNYLEDSDEHNKFLDEFDVLFVGDMYFDQDLGEAVGRLTEDFLKKSAQEKMKNKKCPKSVYVGDPGRWFLTENRPENMLCCAKFELPESVKRENSGLTRAFVFEVV